MNVAIMIRESNKMLKKTLLVLKKKTFVLDDVLDHLGQTVPIRVVFVS